MENDKDSKNNGLLAVGKRLKALRGSRSQAEIAALVDTAGGCVNLAALTAQIVEQYAPCLGR